MTKVLMSINPIHAEKIMSGDKRYEFRKIRCKRQVDVIVIYVTAPIKKVLGEVKVTEVIEDIPQAVWKKTETAAGIDESFFNRYFKAQKTAVAYALGEVTVFSNPKSLSDYGLSVAPQSYAYVE